MLAADPNAAARPAAIRFAIAAAAIAVAAEAGAAMLAQEAARQVGLARAWYSQADVGAGLGVAGATLADGRLLLLTETGRLQAFDAETGAPLWSTRVGPPGHVVLGPSASEDRCAVVAGASVVVYDAETGLELLRQRLLGAPGAAPAVDGDYAFVPLLRGLVEEVPLDPEVVNPRLYASAGAPNRPPTVFGDYLLWTTQRGFVYGADATHEGVVYRFFTAGEPIGPVVADDEGSYVATREGRIYALRVGRGGERWRASLGGDVERPAIVQAGVLYVGTDEPALYALDAATGADRWSVPGVDRFVAASAERVYALDPAGALVVIEAESGRLVDRSPSLGDVSPVVNTATDRVYLVSTSGAIQALREIDADQPYVHGTKADDADGDETQSTEETSTPPEEDPFAIADEPEAPSEETPENDPFAADPFADPADAPAEEPDDASEDPFGDPFEF